MSFRDELAQLMAQRQEWVDQKNKNTIKRTQTPTLDEFGQPIYYIDDENQQRKQYMTDVESGSDDGLNYLRDQNIWNIDQKTPKLREFEAGRQDAVNLAAEDSRRQLAQKLSGVKTGANQRGLLYSGINQGNQAKARATSAGELGKKIGDVNAQFESMYDQNQSGLISNQMNEYRNATNESLKNYKKSMADYQSRAGTGAQVGSAIGAIGGAFLPV